jgi:nucleoside-diphosphate-sugar epimerase
MSVTVITSVSTVHHLERHTMRIFITGASGFIGRAVVPDLIAAGHTVTGLVRSEAAARTVSELGATAVSGSIDDLDVLGRAAADADAVIHLAFKHDLAFAGDYVGAAEADRIAIETLGARIGGDDPTLVIAAGLAGLSFGRPTTENDVATRAGQGSPRLAGSEAAIALAEQGVRSTVVRLAPTVHGAGDQGFVSTYAQIARDRGFVGYVGDGANLWSAVHRLDAARLFRLAAESAPRGSVLHGSAEEGISIRELAEALGESMSMPVRSVPPEDAADHFGWLAGFITMDIPATSAITQERLGWTPTGPSLLDDVRAGHYDR